MKLTDFDGEEPEEEKETLEDKLKDKDLQEVVDMIANCEKCRLHENRTNTVPGEGPENAAIMLIGEGPGENEDEQGRPFVGSAGKKLDECLEKAGINREKIFISNTVKCRPPDNRDPYRDELRACHPYTERIVEIIDPKVIGLLGRVPTKRFLGKESITKVRGQKIENNGRVYIPMFHPAALRYKASREEQLVKDLRTLLDQI